VQPESGVTSKAFAVIVTWLSLRMNKILELSEMYQIVMAKVKKMTLKND
jgi:hypothetical protein